MSTTINVDNAQEIIDHLRKLGKGEILPDNDHTGICNDLAKVFNRGISWDVTKLASKWPKYSGSENFPIPTPSYFDGGEDIAYLCYDNNSSMSMWQDDEYGDNRRELCLFLADCLEKEYAFMLDATEYEKDIES